MPETRLWAPRAWIDGRWQARVLLESVDGHWRAVTPDVAAPPGAITLHGPALPGLVNGHSHAFQRAFAGMAEQRRAGAPDDFWDWRERMYGVALRVTPIELRAIAAQLFVELLRGGYTHVCEFHYLHHDLDGSPYADPLTSTWALCDGAADAGIGLTVLPALYERAGFAETELRHEQRRFAGTPAFVRSAQAAITAARRPLVSAGRAVHSLRAASLPSILELLADDDPSPIHIHVAEQTREVDDCLAATGARPIELLCRELRPDARWQLVHAIHATPTEIDAVATAGAGLVLCPSTEANLGDGLVDLPRWLAAGVAPAIGSDSQVSRAFTEELRWLEYGQRLARRERNVAAAPDAGWPGTADRLFAGALAGGARAAGHRHWGFTAGARADLLVLDESAPGLRGITPEQQLHALVFATDAPAIRDVYVAGQAIVRDGRHAHEDAIDRRFAAAMATLWPEAE